MRITWGLVYHEGTCHKDTCNMVTKFWVWTLENSIMLDKLLSRRQILFSLFFQLMIKTNAHDLFLEYLSSGTFLEHLSSGTFLEYPSSGTFLEYPSSGTFLEYPSSGTFLDYPSSDTFLEYPSSGTLLEYPSSGTLKIERLEVTLFKSAWEQ